MVNIKIRLIIFFEAKDGEALSIQSVKTRWGADCDSDHELLIAKFSLKLKKVGKTTRPFRYQFSSVQSLSHVRLFATPLTAARQAFLSITNSEFTQTHVHRVGDAFQPSHPLSSPSPLAPSPSQHQSLFQWVNSSHKVAKVLEFQL